MLICWHLKEGFNADVIGGRGGGVLSLHYEFFHGDRYIHNLIMSMIYTM